MWVFCSLHKPYKTYFTYSTYLLSASFHPFTFIWRLHLFNFSTFHPSTFSPFQRSSPTNCLEIKYLCRK
ncbi:hypothetical protein HMPREF9151_02422 [Hoylesella saccharolytica F0055]|uniref:Uncharacterized protein n=1 Tax=Hoylesella saccharolytica F0055 TaxID=1127699 RepID=L1MZ37_9BACT|nr:hypothetical protein HMPREF9151_02422 [Hoylesella saccharolytica F0055]